MRFHRFSEALRSRRNLIGGFVALNVAVGMFFFLQQYGEELRAKEMREKEAQHTRGVLVDVITKLNEQSTLILDCVGPNEETECKKRGAAGTGAAIRSIVVEVDCRSRRQAAGLSAPNPNVLCSEQTEHRVYPGGIG